MITAQTIITVVILYLVIINVVGYVIMGVDKKRAIRGAWRISEASLFFTALLGGSLGCVFWVCSTSVIRRSTGISSTECRRSWWYRYCFLPFYSNRKYAILLLYEIKSGRYRYAYSSV